MGKTSFIYRSLSIYRLGMNILYLGKYKKRFHPVIQHIQSLATGSRVLELCFGDIYLAEFCKNAGYKWSGLDINKQFVKVAQNMGFDAHYADLSEMAVLPAADVCIMMGSLYHFYPDTGNILRKMIKASENVVISEPISNLSAKGGLIGFLAKRAANAGKGHEDFRYDKRSLMKLFEDKKDILGFEIIAVEDHGKDLIVKLSASK
jgi:hypothetical protein